MIYVLITLILLGGTYIGYSGNLQKTTNWLGKRIAEKQVIKTTPNSFSSPLEIQTMITPPRQKIRITVTFLLYIAAFCIGFSIIWWASILALICLIAFSSIFSVVCFPRKMEFWIKQVSIGLQNRIADYEKQGDQVRAESLSGFIPILDEWIEFSRTSGIKIDKV